MRRAGHEMGASRRAVAATVACALLGGLVLPVLTTSVPAAAADPKEEAKALSKRAATEFKLAHFQAALDLYTQAYERFPAPALLFNLGQCNKNLGHYERALFFFQGYLRDKPDATNRRAVETLVAETTKQLAAETAEQAEHRKLEELAAEKLAADARAAEERARSGPGEGSPAGPRAEAAPAPPEHRRPVWMIGGAVASGVGLVLLGTGMYFGLHSSSEANQLSQLSSRGGTWTTQDQSTYNSGQSAAHAATGLYVAGAIVFAGGATVALLGLQKRPDGPTITVGAGAVPGGSAMFLGGRF